MSYYPDLSEYEYFPCGDPKPLNVGWLDKSMEFPTGRVANSTIEKLHDYYNSLQNRTRGFHRCNICRGGNRKTNEFLQKDHGSAEVWVLANDGKLFACPELIIHYIVDHDYLPPKEFLEAVNSGPRPNSNAYHHRLHRIQGESS